MGGRRVPIDGRLAAVTLKKLMRKSACERVEIGEVDTVHHGVRHGIGHGGSVGRRENEEMHPGPQDVLAAGASLDVMRSVEDADLRWSAVAVPTDWTALRTVEHISDALLFYAGLVARRAREGHGFVRDGRAAPPSVQLDDAQSAALILAAVLRDLGDERALHPSGLADAAGWAGMAVTELLVHGYDAASALGLALELPADVCRRRPPGASLTLRQNRPVSVRHRVRHGEGTL
jgi:hypothetical protein